MPNYHAYLIRLWREDEQQPWRAELVSPQSGEARRFATPEQAYAYLQQELEQNLNRHLTWHSVLSLVVPPGRLASPTCAASPAHPIG